ncbi:hypothetical protein [Streptomyces levis]|uniref:hypothetical protein n=1 Tax=Streptomyces levis TaxID=285566 RepID=UPI0031D27E31
MATAQHIARQHLISQVLLRQFTMPGPKGSGWQLLPFDLHHPERLHKLKSTRACGWAENFVAFDCASAEELWCSVERRVPDALVAVHAGTPLADPLHVATLRDLVVLHFVRSHHYRAAGDRRVDVLRAWPAVGTAGPRRARTDRPRRRRRVRQ